MKRLVLELPDEEYDAILLEAAAKHQTPEEYLVAGRYKGPSKGIRRRLTKQEEDAAWAIMLAHAGAVDSGDPFSSNNERIDADLVREYGSNHEDDG